MVILGSVDTAGPRGFRLLSGRDAVPYPRLLRSGGERL